MGTIDDGGKADNCCGMKSTHLMFNVALQGLFSPTLKVKRQTLPPKLLGKVTVFVNQWPLR